MEFERRGARARRVADIDWDAWEPADRATLLFVVRGGEILLIRKKRGLGAGKINGPGGRIEAGETPLACAVRELREEVCVTPADPVQHGSLSFQFVDGYAIHVAVFRSEACSGRARETEEAAPLWTPVGAIPYHEMWADDRLWLPLLLAKQSFQGRFVFEGDVMLDHALDVA